METNWVKSIADKNYSNDSRLRKSCIEEGERLYETFEGQGRFQKKYDTSTMIFNKDVFVKFMNEAANGRTPGSGDCKKKTS